MKKLVSLLSVLLLVVFFSPSVVYAFFDSEATLKETLKEEMYAKKMYEEFSKAYPEVKQFTNLIKGENNHIEYVKEVMVEKGYKVEDIKIDEVKVPTSKEEAIKAALDFEINDIASLETRIANEKDESIKNLLINLKEGSIRHQNAMERALNGGGGRNGGNKKSNMMNRGFSFFKMGRFRNSNTCPCLN